jgi:hypothetical protein
MTDADHEDIRRIVEAVVDEREPEPLPGVLPAPPPEPLEPDRGEEVARRREAHDHGDAEAAEEAHEHMPHFLLLVRNEKGEIEELDPSELPRYEEEQEDEDAGDHDHAEKKESKPRKPARRRKPSH